MKIRLFLRFPILLFLLIRLALWNDGAKPIRHPLLTDPIKDAQDDFNALIGIRDSLWNNDFWISGIVIKVIDKWIVNIAADIVRMRNLNVVAAGFIPRDKS